jgi:uncharacterized protein (DUF1800 family)
MRRFFPWAGWAAAAVFCSFSGSAYAISSAVNISTRMMVETGDNVLIGGFIVYGTGQKNIAVRAIGSSLPVQGALSDPILELRDATGAIVASNDNWRSTQQTALIDAGLAPGNDFDSALITTLATGSYTAIVRGTNNATGVALVEVYDLDAGTPPARLGNISTRGRVLTGDNAMIGGFIIQGDVAKRTIVRVKGPSLSLGGIPLSGRMMDPTIALHDGNGVLMSQNDSWRSDQEAEIAASTIAPTDDREPAIVGTLYPGNYTAVVRGAGDTTGIALVEMYDLDQPPQVDGSTLYVTQLRPQGSAITQGSGSSTLRLSGDEKSAVVNFSYSNLSGPITSMHIHTADGTILFDLDDAEPQPDGSLIWVFVPVGSFSVADIIRLIKSGQTYLNLHTALYPTGEIKGFYTISTGAQVVPEPTPPPPLASGPPTPTDAGRFLSQATFGATSALIAQVQNQGFDAFLNEQFAAPISSHMAFVDASGVNPPTITQTRDAWWTRAIAGPDQLRQRVAFALSEILVVSNTTGNLGEQPGALPTYYDVLVRGAFGNFRQLLEDITLNPAMGRYLDMLRNDKANAARTRIPNENFARELMQLFSIGLYRLNLDGSLTLDAAGFPIETYGQEAILGTAAVCTGWTFFQATTPYVFNPPADWRSPMVNVPTRHSTDAKTILDSVMLPANQSAAEDLKTTLDTVFNHPNVGPFICRQLIQRLVTSNPSPGYLYRVASVFNNNGQGVRGDLQAVVRAILMDYDARGSAKTTQGPGHVREPVIRLTNLLRAFGATSPDGKFSIRGANTNLAQEAMHSPTVFNFFNPDYSAPGAIAEAGLKSPELEITNETTVVTVANYLRTGINGGLGPSTARVTLNLSNEIAMAANPTQLVDHLNTLLMASSMSPAMRSILINAVTQIPATNPTERTRTAIYLVINSPEFAVDK